MDIYKVYVWRGERLEYVAENIVAATYEAAKRRGVQAICSRPMDKPDWLMVLFDHVTIPDTEGPDGVTVRVARENPGLVV